MQHKPVMLEEVDAYMAVKAPGFYLDATFGRGGHSEALLTQLGPDGRLFAIDKDPEAIQYAESSFGNDSRFHITQSSFADLDQVAQEMGIEGQLDGILFDLGVSSPQLDTPERGFSFQSDGPLDMRMNPEQGQSAADWVNSASQEKLQEVIKTYGEERFAKRIAAAIVEARAEAPIETTKQLSDIVSNALPFKEKHKHPATRTFQAIRIFINDELEDLKRGLTAAMKALKVGGRLLVITFHSIEDRIVKTFMKSHSQPPEMPRRLPIQHQTFEPALRIIAKKVRATDEELAYNLRARSAILRVAEKMSDKNP